MHRIAMLGRARATCAKTSGARATGSTPRFGIMRLAKMGVTTMAFAVLASCGGTDTPTIITPPLVVAVAVASPPAALAGGGTYQFSAAVTGTSNAAVTWGVDASGNVNVGVINSAGLYTAPSASGRFTVRATSLADPSKSGSATVLVSAAPVTVSIPPSR